MVAQPVSVLSGTFNAAVGERLKLLCEERGVPRERIALALEMSSENIRHYERGRAGLTLRMLPDIAEVFGMTALELAAYLLGDVPAVEQSA